MINFTLVMEVAVGIVTAGAVCIVI